MQEGNQQENGSKLVQLCHPFKFIPPVGPDARAADHRKYAQDGLPQHKYQREPAHFPKGRRGFYAGGPDCPGYDENNKERKNP